MIVSRITFCLPGDGVPGWQLSELKGLASLFRSVVVWINITQSRQANLEHGLKMLSVKNCRYDLCQLAIEGLDAELACMVLTEYISEKFDLVATTHNRKRIAAYQLDNYPPLQSPAPLNWHFLHSHRKETEDKNHLLAQSAMCANPSRQDVLYQALQARETISSTLIGQALALPHIMHSDVTVPTIVFQRPNAQVVWHQNKAPVHLVITLFIPSPTDRQTLIPFTRLTRWLLSEPHQTLLLDNLDDFTLRIIISHIMATYQPE